MPPTNSCTWSAPLIMITLGPPVPIDSETIAASRPIAPAPRSRRGTHRCRLIQAPGRGARRAAGAVATGSSSGDCLVVADREPGQERLEALLDRAAALVRVGLEAAPLDLLAACDDLVHQVGVLVAEERADRVELGVHQRLEEGVGLGDGGSGLRHADIVGPP